MNSKTWAIRHSANAFFNSYLRDMGIPFDQASQCFLVTRAGESLQIPVENFSKVSWHVLGLDFKLQNRAIDFLEAARWIAGDSPRLLARLQNSLHNMEHSLEKRQAAIAQLYSGDVDFLKAEQGLHLGHNVHPTPKARDEFSDEDWEKFAPEFGASFPLTWLLVHESLLWEERSMTLGNMRWQHDLYAHDVPAHFIPYPLHPWQRQVLAHDKIIQDYLKQGWIREGELDARPWQATSSLRSLYNAESPYMLKFSMSVRLTNSLRHLQQNEVTRGMQIHDVFHTPSGLEFRARFPQFHVMHEPAVMAIKDPSGAMMPQTVVLLRENPFRISQAAVAVLATLTQENPIGGPSLIENFLKDHDSMTWFAAFVERAIKPLIMAQADYGIMLGAHQQNLLIQLEDGLPVGAYFRDCQGTGHSELAIELYLSSLSAPEKFLPHLVPSKAANDLFGYYLVVNSVLSTIAAVARAAKTDEDAFIGHFRSALQTWRGEVRDPSFIDHLLQSATLGQKGNFRCSVAGINENTTDDPLSIYNPFTNPFFVEAR